MKWMEYNPNPTGRNTGDCVVRALSKALCLPWDEAYDLVSDMAKAMGEMPSSNAAWGAVLRMNGFVRRNIPNTCPDCYTAEDFANDHPEGIYVLCFGTHVATIEDGSLYDSWDSRREIPQFYWTERR